MATNATAAPLAQGSKTAAPRFSAPKDSMAARLRPVAYDPLAGTAAAWDALQWRLTLARSTVESAYSLHKHMPDGPDKEAQNGAICDAEEVRDDIFDTLLSMPAPHMSALLWKLHYVIEIQSDGFTASLSSGTIKPVLDDAARFAAAQASPTRLDSEWGTARSFYVEAREGEARAEAEGDEAAERRWEMRRVLAEDALMGTPSPDAAAFAFKYLVAHGGGRETDCWDTMLEAEATRFAQSEA